VIKILIQALCGYLFIMSSTYSAESLFYNPDFSDGFIVKDPKIEQVLIPGKFLTINGKRCQAYKDKASGGSHILKADNRKKNPTWSIAQWGSRANLLPSHGAEMKARVYKWENYYKKLIYGKNGSGYRYLTLGVRADREYRGVFNYERDPCREKIHPHLYISQAPKAIPLGSMNKLVLKVGAKVSQNYMTASRIKRWNKKLATSHFVIQINVQNIRKDKNIAKGHAQSFGMGVNLFDARNEGIYYKEKVFMHKPQQRLILYINPNELGKNVTDKLHSGRWSIINKDILPFIRKSFRKAIEEGKKSKSNVQRLYSENLKDYRITSVNFGWEASSLHSSEMRVSEFQLLFD
jgi:hypothetical protein